MVSHNYICVKTNHDNHKKHQQHQTPNQGAISYIALDSPDDFSLQFFAWVVYTYSYATMCCIIYICVYMVQSSEVASVNNAKSHVHKHLFAWTVDQTIFYFNFRPTLLKPHMWPFAVLVGIVRHRISLLYDVWTRVFWVGFNVGERPMTSKHIAL